VENETMTPLRSFAFLAFLMVFSSTGTTRAAMEETNLINDPFQSTSCRDAQMYCEQTITPAIEQDSTLKQFLRDERKEAKRTQSWESVVPEERMKQMKVPETLALGTFGVGVGVGVLCVRMRSILTELSSFSFSLTLSLSLSLFRSRCTDVVVSFTRMLPTFRRVRFGIRRAEREPKARRARARRSGEIEGKIEAGARNYVFNGECARVRRANEVSVRFRASKVISEGE